jgi:hypothetical protein
VAEDLEFSAKTKVLSQASPKAASMLYGLLNAEYR